MYLFKREKKPWRRRNYFIDKKFQLRFILRYLAVVVAGSAVSGILMYAAINKNVEEAFYSSHIRVASTGELVRPALLGANFGVLTFVLFAVAVVTLFLSLKVAGPLFRLGKGAEKIGQGDLTGNFALREGDELKGLAGSFQGMNDSLKEQFNDLKNQAEDVDRAAAALLKFYASEPGLERLDERAELDKVVDISERLTEMRERLSRFKMDRKAS